LGDEFEEKKRAAIAILAQAAQRTYERPQSARSKRALIVALKPQIAELRRKGATWETVAEILASTVGASADTIRAALKRPNRSVSAAGAGKKQSRSGKSSGGERDIAPAPASDGVPRDAQATGVAAESVIAPALNETQVPEEGASPTGERTFHRALTRKL